MGRIRIATPALATGALIAAALACGCGSTSKPLTREQLTSRANAICRSVKAKLEAANKGQSFTTRQELERLIARLSSFEESALGELTKLTPPPALETEWKRFVAGAQALVEDTVRLGEQASQGNSAQSKQLIAAAQATQRQMTAVAKRVGLEACEQVP
jgi:hypothetical protein